MNRIIDPENLSTIARRLERKEGLIILVGPRFENQHCGDGAAVHIYHNVLIDHGSSYLRCHEDRDLDDRKDREYIIRPPQQWESPSNRRLNNRFTFPIHRQSIVGRPIIFKDDRRAIFVPRNKDDIRVALAFAFEFAFAAIQDQTLTTDLISSMCDHALEDLEE